MFHSPSEDTLFFLIGCVLLCILYPPCILWWKLEKCTSNEFPHLLNQLTLFCLPSEATRSSQRDCLLLWDELEAQWKDLISLSKDISGLATQLLDVGQCLGSSYPDQVEKGECEVVSVAGINSSIW